MKMLTEETAQQAGLVWGYCHGCAADRALKDPPLPPKRGAVKSSALTVDESVRGLRNQCACGKDFKPFPPA